jgi:DNA-binding response OmpR family regulator
MSVPRAKRMGKKRRPRKGNVRKTSGKIFGRILVVDDEPDFGSMVAKALRKIGCQVDEAVDAHQAIALQHRHAYDMAVVDLRMPDMTGLELLHYLKTRDKRLFVIIMTAYGSLHVGIEALKRGACDYISKPFKLKVLQSRVRTNLGRRRRYLEEQSLHLRNDTVDEY